MAVYRVEAAIEWGILLSCRIRVWADHEPTPPPTRYDLMYYATVQESLDEVRRLRRVSAKRLADLRSVCTGCVGRSIAPEIRADLTDLLAEADNFCSTRVEIIA